MSQAEIDVLAERQRQIHAEGFDEAHDEKHEEGQLALAAICYAIPLDMWDEGFQEKYWPWGNEWFKPKDYRRDLVRAAALIIAEIDRMDRAMLDSEPGRKGESGEITVYETGGMAIATVPSPWDASRDRETISGDSITDPGRKEEEK
jgi:hypothetical protein